MHSLNITPQILRTDLGGEFDNARFRSAADALSLRTEYVVPDGHVNSAENAHYRVLDIARANIALSKGALGANYRGYAYECATNQIMLAGFHFGSDSDLTGFAPYVSLVAYHNPSLLKNTARASLGLYVGPRRESGPGAVYSCPCHHLAVLVKKLGG